MSSRPAASFRKHGHWVVFCLRFSPFMRSIISLPAGLVHMPLGKFLAYTFAGSAIWNVLLIKGGQWLERYFADSQPILAWIVGGLLGLSVLGYARLAVGSRAPSRRPRRLAVARRPLED